MAEQGGEKKQEEVKRHTYPLIRVSSPQQSVAVGISFVYDTFQTCQHTTTMECHEEHGCIRDLCEHPEEHVQINNQKSEMEKQNHKLI